MSSNINDHINKLRSQLESLHIPKQTEGNDTGNRTDDVTSVPDSSGSSGSSSIRQPITTAPLTPIAPTKKTNPHPYLSISTAILQDAIMEYLKPDSRYGHSILRRATMYDDWRWMPYVASRVTIQHDDVELVCIKDDVFRSKIDRNENVFEHPDNVGRVSPIGANMELDFAVPEYSGWRVLVWRLHVNGGSRSPWMDRMGCVVADPRANLHQ
ncbi:hypothetical protein FSHL1_012572 [Fusarium sambucinum]